MSNCVVPKKIEPKPPPFRLRLVAEHWLRIASPLRTANKARRRYPAFALVAWLAALAVTVVAVRAESSAPLVDHRAPGPDAPPTGRSLFEMLFAGGVPFPFSSLLDRLKEEVGAHRVVTALVPLGRSLQRFSAHPNYFDSPRLVVAVPRCGLAHD